MGLFTKNNDDKNPFKEAFEEIDKEEQDKVKQFIGKYYKYKKEFNDEYFTYIKVIRTDRGGYLVIDRFGKRRYANIQDAFEIERYILDADQLKFMIEINQEEHELETNKILDILGL